MLVESKDLKEKGDFFIIRPAFIMYNSMMLTYGIFF